MTRHVIEIDMAEDGLEPYRRAHPLAEGRTDNEILVGLLLDALDWEGCGADVTGHELVPMTPGERYFWQAVERRLG